MADKNTLLKEINETSFAVTDLTLYLDMHPDDTKALEMFNKVKAQRKAAMDAFEKEFYPLTVDCISLNKDNWKWNQAPATWKAGETNVEL